MSLLLREETLTGACRLILQQDSIDVTFRVTAEWLRGVPEPTWYGSFSTIDADVAILPGRYYLLIGDETTEILVRRPIRTGAGLSFSFWGVGDPPAFPEHADVDADGAGPFSSHDALPRARDGAASGPRVPDRAQC